MKTLSRMFTRHEALEEYIQLQPLLRITASGLGVWTLLVSGLYLLG